MTCTMEFASRLHELSFDSLDEITVARAKLGLADLCGVILAGQREPHMGPVVDYIRPAIGESSAGLATRVGSHDRYAAEMAAFINAVAAHGPELDDVSLSASVHPGNVIVPVVLALGERQGSTGSELLLALVSGYEAMIRIGWASGSGRMYERGFHPTGVCGTFGAAVAAAKLLGLTEEQLLWALGIAGSLTAGSMEYLADGAWSKRLQPAHAAATGIAAAELARRGYTGPRTILEGANGFWVGHTPCSRPELLLSKWRSPFAINEVGIKPFACCRDIHQSLTAAGDLMQRSRVDTTEIERIDLCMAELPIRLVAEPREPKIRPATSVDAQFSVYYALANFLITGSAGIEDFSGAALTRPQVSELAARVFVVHDETLDAYYPHYRPVRLSILLKDGSVLRQEAKVPLGDPERPLSFKDVAKKFTDLARPTLEEQQARIALELLMRTEQLSTTRELIDCLTPPQREAR